MIAWRRPGDKPLFQPIMVRLVTYLCVTQPQWVKHELFVFNPDFENVNKSNENPSYIKDNIAFILHWPSDAQNIWCCDL